MTASRSTRRQTALRRGVSGENVPVAGSAAVDDSDLVESTEAICDFLSRRTPEGLLSADVGRREGLRQVIRQKGHQIIGGLEPMGRHHIEQLTVDCAPPASAASETRVVHLHTSLIDHHHLEREVGMIDEGRNADEFIEEIVESATLRRAPIGHAFPGQGDASSDRVNHQYLMVRKQAVEFGTHGTK